MQNAFYSIAIFKDIETFKITSHADTDKERATQQVVN
jgi:hypothetical protein